MKTFSRLSVSFVLVAFLFSRSNLVSADQLEPPKPNPAALGKVGVILTLTGSFAAIGADGSQGIEAAIDEAGSAASLLTTVFADSKGDATTGVSEFRRLVDVEKVAAVYAFRGPVGTSINPISKASKIPLLGGVGNKEFAESNEFAFQLWPRSDIEGKFIADSVHSRGFKQVATLTAQDDWTMSVTAGFREAFKTKGGQIAIEKEVIPVDQDFRVLLQQIRAKKVDAIFINIAISQIGPFLKQKRELKIDTPTFSNFWVGKKEVIETAGVEGVEGIMFNEMSTNLPKLNAYLKQKHGTSASGATLSAYLGMKLLFQSLDPNDPALTPAIMQAGLLKQTEIKTPDGNFTIEKRCVNFPLTMKVIRNGKAEILN